MNPLRSLSWTTTRATSSSTPIGTSSHLTDPSYAHILLSVRWRQVRARRLQAEEVDDARSRAYDEKEAENLRKEIDELNEWVYDSGSLSLI